MLIKFNVSITRFADLHIDEKLPLDLMPKVLLAKKMIWEFLRKLVNVISM